MARGIRKSITIPGLLAEPVAKRGRETGSEAFAPYALELVCYDLRSQSRHEITVGISHDTITAQEAVDRALISHYQPGKKRSGLLIKLVERISELQSVASRHRHELPLLPPLNVVAERLTFPPEIWPLVASRWQQLGYSSLSAYVTGLIRYDLLVAGPHATAKGECRSKKQQVITRRTLTAQIKGAGRKILLDHEIERATGRRVKPEEMRKLKADIAQTLRRMAVPESPEVTQKENSSPDVNR